MRIALEIILADEERAVDKAGLLKAHQREIGAAREYCVVGCR